MRSDFSLDYQCYYYCNCTETNCNTTNVTNVIIKIFRVFGGLRIPCFDGRLYKIEIFCRVLGVFLLKTRKSDVVTK